MVKRKTAIKIRRTHRYLGVFLGLQFLMWTISGLYFSWTDIDEIHGDHFRRKTEDVKSFTNLMGFSDIENLESVFSVELRNIAGEP